jgi:hypothetical protein
MHWWTSEIPIGWKSLSSQRTLGPDPIDAVVVETSSFWSPCKMKRLFPTEPPR